MEAYDTHMEHYIEKMGEQLQTGEGMEPEVFKESMEQFNASMDQDLINRIVKILEEAYPTV